MSPEEPLSIVSRRVFDGSEPLRVVARSGDGSRQFLCRTTVDVDHLLSTHAHPLVDEFPDVLAPLRGLRSATAPSASGQAPRGGSRSSSTTDDTA